MIPRCEVKRALQANQMLAPMGGKVKAPAPAGVPPGSALVQREPALEIEIDVAEVVICRVGDRSCSLARQRVEDVPVQVDR